MELSESQIKLVRGLHICYTEEYWREDRPFFMIGAIIVEDADLDRLKTYLKDINTEDSLELLEIIRTAKVDPYITEGTRILY